jgi:hypothetical protein
MTKAQRQAPDRPTNPGIIAQPLLGHIQILAIHLISSASERFPALDSVKEFKFPIGNSQKISVEFDSKINRVIATVDFELEVKDDTGIYVKISARYRSIYQILNSFVGENIEQRAVAFCHAFSTGHVWPYWREYLSSMCLKLGIPSIVAPMMIFGPPLSTGSPIKKAEVKLK